jgi:deoxyribodipyrimidine photo-lyase
MKDFIYFWFRRDLRLNDNHGLFRALTSGFKVRGIFIFDTQILDALHKPHDARVEFIHHEIKELATETNGGFDVFYGNSIEIWENLLKNASNTGLKGIYSNRDYEPSAIKRDQQIEQLCLSNRVDFQQFKDQVIFEQAEVVKDDGKPYTVFTPYMKKWKTRLDQVGIELYPSENHKEAFLLDERFSLSLGKIPTLEEMGFAPTGIDIPQKSIDQGRIRKYEQTRDIPSIIGTSRLSVHFRFGTISIREKFKNGYSLSEKWINELIWREFYMQILWHFPQVVTESFKPQYDRIQWENNQEHFEFWKQGKTGYPLVDAGMRELNSTGFMHNRVRMVVASFLTKHLLIDWRWGEAYFAEKLLDFELSSNNGGWQWAAGSGVDAAPYFRVFNPTAQMEKFDPQLLYIKKWVPEYGTIRYPKPIVEHAFARLRCLERYKSALG